MGAAFGLFAFPAGTDMENMRMHRVYIVTSILALALTAPIAAFAQDEPPATFNERYPDQPPLPQTPAQPALPETPSQPASAAKQQTTPMRHARIGRPRARIVVVRRSYLDAGTQLSPGERKFLDYAQPALHQPYNVVTNVGGRVGWHNSPLPGPFFPNAN
jgi:hypothetical protein